MSIAVDRDRRDDDDKRGSVASTSLGIASNILGAGMVSLPFCFGAGGLVPGLATFGCSLVFAFCSYLLYAYLSQLTQLDSLTSIAHEAFGGPTALRARWIQLSTFGMCVGNTINQLIIVADSIGSLLLPLPAWDRLWELSLTLPALGVLNQTLVFRFVVLVALGVLIVYPVCLPRSLHAQRYTSMTVLPAATLLMAACLLINIR